MLTVGDRLPSFQLQSVVAIEAGKELPSSPTTATGKWKLLFAWPMDFTFVSDGDCGLRRRRRTSRTATARSWA